MKKLKKALSTALTATLLASLLAIGAVGTVSAAASTYLGACTPASCSQVADGASLVQVNAAAVGAIAANGGFMTISGASFTSASGVVAGADFVYVNSSRVDIVGGGAALAGTEWVRILAPATAGTATITVWTYDAGWMAGVEGTKDITFYAASALTVSPSLSTVTLANTSRMADGSDTTTLTVVVKNGNGTTITGSTVIAVTITPVGIVADAAAFAQVATSSDGELTVKGSGIPGAATIAISVTYNSATTSLGTKSITFTGAVASITATTAKVANSVGGLVAGTVTFTAKDAANNAVSTTVDSVTVGTGAPFTAALGVDYDAATPTDGTVGVTCTTAGSGTLTVTDGSITSNAVTVYCSGAAASFTVAFDKTTVAPGGTATITVTAVDSGSRPAYGTNLVTPVVSAGAFTPLTANLASGSASFTYLAPFNTGTATVLVSVAGITGSQSASINISTPVVVSAASAASALGVTTAGPFTTTTKVAALGKYVTVKMSFGASAAGATVGIWTASKNSAGVWSAFTQKTSRIADASGNVYFYWRSSSAAWLSIQGRTASASANAVQARWK